MVFFIKLFISAQKDSKNIREEGSTRRREADGSMPVSKANEPRERSPNLFGRSNPFAPHISNRVFVYGWFIVCQGTIAPTREFDRSILGINRTVFSEKSKPFVLQSSSSRLVFLKSVVFYTFSNSLVSNFNGFYMVLEYVRNEEFNDFV